MAVSQVMIALYGSYEPTGMYSFEFRRPDGGRISEIFFLLPPESASTKESQRASLIPTLKGGFLADHGNEFKEISLAGSSHFFYAGSTKHPGGAGRTIGQFGQQANGQQQSSFIDGYTEFIKLRYMVSRYRDYTLTPDGKINAPDFTGEGLGSTSALKKFVEDQVDKGRGALANQVDMIYHDYDYDEHWFVKVDSLRIDRNKGDPWTIKYNIELKAYQWDDRKASSYSSPSARIQSQSKKKLTSSEQIKELIDQSSSVHLYSVPETVNLSTAGGIVPLPSAEVAQEGDVQNPAFAEETVGAAL